MGQMLMITPINENGRMTSRSLALDIAERFLLTISLQRPGEKIAQARSIKHIWVFPTIGVPQNGWFIMGNPIKMDDLGVPLFLKTPIYLKRSTVYVGCALFTNLGSQITG